MIGLIYVKELMLLKLITVKNTQFAIIGILIVGLNFKNLLVRVSLNISNITIIAVKGTNYYCITYSINKSDAVHLLKNSVLDDCKYI